MSALRNVEDTIGGFVERVFGRLFRGHVEPVELARKLAREMEDHKTVSVTRVYVPNEYVIYLSQSDRNRFSSFEGALTTELGVYLSERARFEGFTLLSEPQIRLDTDADLRVGEYGIACRVVDPPAEVVEPEEVDASTPDPVQIPPPFAPAALAPSAPPPDAPADEEPVDDPESADEAEDDEADEDQVPAVGAVPADSQPGPDLASIASVDAEAAEALDTPIDAEPQSVPEPVDAPEHEPDLVAATPESEVPAEPESAELAPPAEPAPTPAPEPEPVAEEVPVLDPAPSTPVEPEPTPEPEPEPVLEVPAVEPAPPVPTPPPAVPAAEATPVAEPPAPPTPAAVPLPPPGGYEPLAGVSGTQILSADEARAQGLVHEEMALLVDGRRHLVSKRQTTLGRSRDCDIVLQDANASRQHAEIRHIGLDYFIVDSGSTNGTLVNGQRIRRHALTHGDRIVIGTTELVVEHTA